MTHSLTTWNQEILAHLKRSAQCTPWDFKSCSHSSKVYRQLGLNNREITTIELEEEKRNSKLSKSWFYMSKWRYFVQGNSWFLSSTMAKEVGERTPLLPIYVFLRFWTTPSTKYLDLNNVGVIVTNERWPDKLVLDGACQCWYGRIDQRRPLSGISIFQTDTVHMTSA